MKDIRLARYSRVGRLVLSTLFLISPAIAQPAVQIKGSDTLIYLGQRVASIYQGGPNSLLQIQGGGPPQTISPNQIAQWEGKSRGESGADVIFPIGVQTIVIYVNRANPVRELTLAQVRKIFLGEITNWKEFGGADSRILLYAGESSTGTLAYFQEAMLRDQEPYPFVGTSNTKDLLDEIAQHTDAIGYGSLASNPDVRPISIKVGPASLAIEPTRDNIRSRQYPITRYIYWAVSSKANASAMTVCHWVLSASGQLVIESVGFEPLLPADRAAGLSKLDGAAARVLPVSANR